MIHDFGKIMMTGKPTDYLGGTHENTETIYRDRRSILADRTTTTGDVRVCYYSLPKTLLCRLAGMAGFR